MRPREIERLGREVVPGTGTLEIETLGTGLLNETYRVVRDGAAYSLRVAAEHPAESPVDLKPDVAWEAQVLRAASSLGLSPPLVYCDAARAVLVARWVEGRSWSPEEVSLPESVRTIAALQRRVHAMPVPTPARIMSPGIWVKLYGAALSRARRPVDQGLVMGATGRLHQLAELPSAAGVVCHSDLHTMNLIRVEQSLLLIDWEYAHVSDPLWDLAGWSANNDFGEELQRDLLANYLGNEPSSSTWMRFGLLVWLYDYIALLWSELYLCLRREAHERISLRAMQLDARLRLPAH